MSHKIFTVYDIKAKYHKVPFYTKTTGEALRSFETVAQDQQHEIGKYPSDFNLVELGKYDEITGQIEMLEKPVTLANASEYAKKTL